MLESRVKMHTDNTLPIEVCQTHIVSVRSLVEFVLQAGDITPGGFQRRDRAQLGTQGHKRVQRSRPEGYEAEVEISYLVESADPTLEVRGRIDGLYAGEEPVIIEEIKTTTLSLELVNEEHNHLHWAQAQCYAYMYARQHNRSEVSIHLTYYHLDSQKEKTFERHFTLAELQTFFSNLTTPYLNWFRKIHAWQTRRDQSIQQLNFPYDDYRPGQRDMAVAVYKTIRDKGRLYVQSPTGVGKTIATLFPAVKALGQGAAAKIFYLTAKTSGRLVAEKALDDMRLASLRFKSVTLTAKEKICFCPPVNCDPEVCVFARDYFGKVKRALEEIDQYQAFTRPVIEEIAQRHQLCPFEFSLDLALWVDCIICDYNYAFDPRVYLHRFFDFSTEAYIFLVDEAHNLPDRARAMYSAELDKKTVLDLQRRLKPHLPVLAKKLAAINKLLLEIRKTCQAEGKDALVEYTSPEQLLKAIREFNQDAEDWLAMNQATEFRLELLEFYFICCNYLRTAEYFNTFYVSYFERQGQVDLKAKLFCLDPAPMLAGPLERSQSTIFFSATLLPLDYFMKLLTGEAEHPKRIFQSPFPTENVSLMIHNGISTKYAQRTDSYATIASAIETICNTHVGNYLVFFPSYAYLTAVLELLIERLPERQFLVQDRGMTEAAREAFLARFSAGNQETMVGLAVMGGIFGEGIDLVGERLIGAVVVGVGVPQVCIENDLIKEYFERQNGSGFAYAYQYPGFNRVLQATGRVIRTEADRGAIILIDERFTHARYRRLFPSHWQGFQVVQSNSEIKDKLERFWLQD
ncbi:MAG: ATP-dependent helicase [Chloroflexi bacterium HGW-Chloroflexi-10]|nr:MAG: ATP-dependent helicase [Chloroflexi bacterium HGW-Chloroflexi-10]